jgi:uncharacterized membrane protein
VAGTPPRRRVLSRSLSGPGATLAALFFAFSLLPSLLPRPPLIQGALSGVTVMIGYGIGAGAQALWKYLHGPTPHGRARTITIGIVLAGVGLVTCLAVWRQVGWQNDVRSTMGMAPVTPLTWPVILVVTALVSALILVVARSLRVMFGAAGHWLGRWMPLRLARVLGTVALLALFWVLITGVLVRGFFAGANAVFSTTDAATAPGITQPVDPERSGSPDSLVDWDTLGREGRTFTGSGPTPAQLEQFNGPGAKVPIRAYVGLKSADTLQERADLLLAELKRTGAFDREVLVVATTTGGGILDVAGIEPLEYLYNGNTAIAGLQYSYLPSWISLLADQATVTDASRAVFDTIHAFWTTLPEQSRPQLHLYGLSLGAYGVESILRSINIVNAPISGALMVGPPFVSPLHDEIEADREPGSPAWQPIYQDGSTVRFATEEGGLDRPPGPWGPTRMAYLQHNSDPVVFFSPTLALRRPDWLGEGQRGPDISPDMVWFPLVTMWQVALDLPGAASAPSGFGHMYSRRANLESWVALTRPADWTDQRTDELVEFMGTQGQGGQ